MTVTRPDTPCNLLIQRTRLMHEPVGSGIFTKVFYQFRIETAASHTAIRRQAHTRWPMLPLPRGRAMQ